MKHNKLIAEFMGLNLTANGTKCENPKHNDGTISPIQFHSSWDWLMPVICKINNTPIEKHELKTDIWDNLFEINIGLTYRCVVNLIKWHNEKQLLKR
jgi:hypothetical protein